MKAAVLHDFDRLVVDDVVTPEPAMGEVVVRIMACGFCATDYKAIRGFRRNVEFPFIPGHEASGTVSAVGPGVSSVREGDEVIIQPSGYCGTCRNCREGNTHYCENAFTTGGDGPDDVRPGAFAEYMKTDARCCLPKPAHISFDQACLTEPLSGAWKGLVQYSQMQVGDSVIVIGVGGIGLLCLMVAAAAGAGRLIAVDISETALNNARRLGATDLIDASKCDPEEAVHAVLPGGADIILEAAGSIEAVELMFSLRRRGTRVNLFGITTHERFSLDGGLTHFLEGRMDASFGTTPLAMSKAIRLIETGLVDPGQIITHTFPLDRIGEAVTLMGESGRNKIIINP